MPQTAIVIPCYNEAARLDLDAFRAFTTSAQADGVRFVFVNDGSRDATLGILNEFAAENPDRYTVHNLPVNQGKAEAVRQGMARALADDPDMVGFWDADLATPLEDIPDFATVLDERPDLMAVFGSRVNLLGRNVQRKLIRHYIGRIFATAAAAILRVPIYDTQCGAKMFRVNEETRSIFMETFSSKWVFDVELIARMIQYRRGTELPPVRTVLYEFPLMSWRDVAGSKLKLRDFLTVGLDLVHIHSRYMSV